MVSHSTVPSPPAEPLSPARLAIRRRGLGLSQRALGKLVGVPRNTIARWERGEMGIARPDSLAQVLDRLEVRERRPPGQTVEVPRSPSEESSDLPGELNTFIGREKAVADCCSLLSHRRLITLTGAGGIGKSRLAMEVARCSAGNFRDGVFLAELGSADQPAMVPHIVATALGLSELAGDGLIDMLEEVLRPQQLLLILDDCDRVVDACAALANQLLHGVPGLSILATSREALDARGEVVWRVAPLATPSPNANFDDIASSEAVRLFVERARDVAPWFVIDSTNSASVAELCRRLDGIPLAIELAAAHMKALEPDQVLSRLHDSFELLAGSSRTAPTRQQTLRATIDWSYQLLTQPERALFRRLAVFCGGFRFEAAERVAEGEPIAAGDTLRVLERLIDKSLVVPEDRGGIIRLRLLDTVRNYAYERLVEADEQDPVQRRHFDVVLDGVESIDPARLTTRCVAAFKLELDNLRSALSWAIKAAEPEPSLRLAAKAVGIWEYRGLYGEGMCWLKRALALPRTTELPLLRGRALKALARLSHGLGDMRAARTAILKAQELIVGDADAREPPLCAQLLGDIKRATGDLDGALRLYRQALADYEARGLRFWEEVTQFMIGSVLFEQADYAGSRAACQRCIDLGGEFAWATARARVVLAYLAHHEGDELEAERLAEEALMHLRTQSEMSGTGIALRALAQFALDQRRFVRSATCLAEALEIALTQGDRMALARTLETMACVLATHTPDKAARVAGAAATLRTHTGTVPWPTEQARLERWLGLARSQIQAPAYTDNWRLGSSWSEAESASAARRYVAEALADDADPAQRAADESPLTPRQRDVAALVARGLTNEQIGQELIISPATARAHVEHILDRLDLHSRAQLAAWTVANGIEASPAT